MSDIFGNDSTGSMDMLVDISSATTPQETVSLTFNNDLPQFKTSSKYFESELNKFVKVLKILISCNLTDIFLKNKMEDVVVVIIW